MLYYLFYIINQVSNYRIRELGRIKQAVYKTRLRQNLCLITFQTVEGVEFRHTNYQARILSYIL